MKLYFARPKIDDNHTKALRSILEQYWDIVDPFEENIGIPEEDIVEFDYTLISGCYILFAYIPKSDHRNIGVICEIREAYNLNKIIYCLTYEKNPFLDKYCTKYWTDWEAFINDL